MPRPKKRAINGWLVVDKPVGVTSTGVVARLKKRFGAKKLGHAGTLDPLACGLLPLAFGEATKTVPFVQDGDKHYVFTVRWGVATTTDDAEGAEIASSAVRPSEAAIKALLPGFVGEVMQMPPQFSALKIKGERAYDLARTGQEVVLEPRPVRIEALHLIVAHEDEATFTARCGKGTYVRAIARDLGAMLGCYGHVTGLRRLSVGPFSEADSVPLATLEDAPDEALLSFLLPVHTALHGLPKLELYGGLAARVRAGQTITLPVALAGGAPQPPAGMAYAMGGGKLLAFGACQHGEFVPTRVFEL